VFAREVRINGNLLIYHRTLLDTSSSPASKPITIRAWKLKTSDGKSVINYVEDYHYDFTINDLVIRN